MKIIAAPKVNLGEEKSKAEFLGRGGVGAKGKTTERNREGRKEGVGQGKYVMKKRQTRKSEIDDREKQEEIRRQKRQIRQGLGGTG